MKNYTLVKLFETCPLKRRGFLESKSSNLLVCKCQLCDKRSVTYSLWNWYPAYKFQIVIFISPFWGRNIEIIYESTLCKLFYQYFHGTFSPLELSAFCNVCTFKGFKVIVLLHTPDCISTSQHLLYIDPSLAWHPLCFASVDKNVCMYKLLQLISVPCSSHAGSFKQSWIQSPLSVAGATSRCLGQFFRKVSYKHIQSCTFSFPLLLAPSPITSVL